MLKKIIYIFAFFTLVSCNYFEKKKISISDNLIDQKLRDIDLVVVDKYPVFKECEDINNDAFIEKKCFTNTLSNYITDYLYMQKIMLSEVVSDTINVPILVNLKGEISLQNFIISERLQKNIPELKNILFKSISNLPKIKPAYKKLPQTGELIPVNTRFVIPIHITE